MKIQQEKIDKLNSIIKIKLEPSDYITKVDKSIKEQAKKMNLPGFRKGMVPSGHVKKMYGKSILIDEINNILSDELNKYIVDNKLEVLGQPLPKVDAPKDYEWNFDEEFEFDYEMALAPEIDFKFSGKDKFTFYKIVPDEESIKERIVNLRRTYGKLSSQEVSEEGDNLFGTLAQLSPDGSVFEGGYTNSTTIRMEWIKDKSTLKKFIGLKKESEISINLNKAFDDAHRVAHLLNIDESTAKDLKSEFKFTVQNITRVAEAELTQEFFNKVYGEGKVNNEEELHAELKREMEIITLGNADQKLRNEIYEYGIAKFKSDLPNEFLKRWLFVSNENKVSKEEIEKQYPDFAKNLKWTLIENKIVKEHNIEVKGEEVIAATKKKIEGQFKMYSPAPLEDAQLTNYAMDFLKDRNRASQAFEEVKSVKVFDFIKSIVKLEDKEISFKKFMELK